MIRRWTARNSAAGNQPSQPRPVSQTTPQTKPQLERNCAACWKENRPLLRPRATVPLCDRPASANNSDSAVMRPAACRSHHQTHLNNRHPSAWRSLLRAGPDEESRAGLWESQHWMRKCRSIFNRCRPACPSDFGLTPSCLARSYPGSGRFLRVPHRPAAVSASIILGPPKALEHLPALYE